MSWAMKWLLGIAILARFIAVTHSPPGFYVDEAAISSQVICVQQSGHNLAGEHLPLFTEVLDQGYLTPTYLYPAVVWTKIFGNSITSFREFTAFFSLLFIAGTFVFGSRLWKSRDAGLLSALAAAVSPWVFQFSRIAWDPSLAPAFSIWAFALLFGETVAESIGAGVLFSFAAYTYPPLRVQLAIALVAALILRRTKRDALAVISALIVSLPLLQKTLSGEIQARFERLSVFNPYYLKAVYGDASVWSGLKAFSANMLSLVNPFFLFVSGDVNLRHSTGYTGIWSWLDIFALIMVALTQRKTSKTAIFVLVGYIAGLIPSALTWDSNPHALRSFGAVTFLVVATGGALTHVSRKTTIAIASVWFAFFMFVYFVQYPPTAERYFDTEVVKRQGHVEGYKPLGRVYYELVNGTKSCR